MAHSGLSTAEISKTMTSLLTPSATQVHFLGVFPSDQFPVASFLYPTAQANSINTPAICTIINTDPSTSPGQHRVAFFKSQNGNVKEVEFFDSYGQKPDIYGFNFPPDFHIISNTFPLQSLNTSVCGHYCILYFYLRSSNLIHCTLDQVTVKIHSLAKTSTLHDHQVKLLVSKLAHASRHRNSRLYCPSTLLPSALDLAQPLMLCPQISRSYSFRHAYLIEPANHSSFPISEFL